MFWSHQVPGVPGLLGLYVLFVFNKHSPVGKEFPLEVDQQVSVCCSQSASASLFLYVYKPLSSSPVAKVSRISYILSGPAARPRGDRLACDRGCTFGTLYRAPSRSIPQ
eukprot:scaffold40062_cov67-Phaeocystis_antarctica.AAC.3